MKNRVIKTRAVFSTILILAAVSIFIITCKNPASPGGPPGTPNGETRLVISMHDSRLASTARAANKEDTRNIQALNLAVREMNISGPDGGWLTIMSEPRSIDIIAASRGDPVVLSDVSVEPGVYKELRLVLSDGSTIRVDGEEFPLKVPSGEQSGLKLKGPFEIPKGKLFTLVIDLDTAKSVNWNQGQGWRLQPVLSVSNGATVLGVFRGNLAVARNIGVNETLLQLYSDNNARMRVSRYPNYTLWADYEYHSVRKELRFTNIRLDTPGLRRRALKEVLKEIPDQIALPVKQWSLDNIIAIDANGITANLYRVDEFNFSSAVSFTEFILNIDYPDASKIGKDVVTEIHFIDTGMPLITIESEFEGGRITEKVQVPDDFIQGPSTRIQITSYLFERPENKNMEMGVYASEPTLMMTGSHFSKSTANPWQPPAIFTLVRDAGGEFTVAFPPSMNVRMDHGNFTDNKPVLSWDSYPGANNGYFVLVLVKNKEYDPNGDNSGGNAPFIIPAFHSYTAGNSVTVDSELISFTPGGPQAARIEKGDFIRIEVYALDNSGFLNTAKRTGALFRDTLTVVR